MEKEGKRLLRKIINRKERRKSMKTHIEKENKR